ncbi:MAG: polyprenyl synthetase family protein [Clostridia bacterium]
MTVSSNIFDETLLDIYAERVQSTLNEILSYPPQITQKPLFEAMRYSAFSGGKRVRPFLTYEFCKACTNDSDTKAPDYYAAAIEMIHTFSLIHDDLPAMDDDVLRRGKPTNHVIFGEATAILAGDSLITSALEAVCNNNFCTDTQNLRAARLICEKSGAFGMLGGQQIDLQSEGVQIGRETLNELHTLKTGCLFSCACMLGCIAANADNSLIAAAEEYGNCLGLAFQIKDDILDIEGDPKKMGKTLHKDDISKKNTYPLLYGSEQSKITLHTLTEKAIAALDAFSGVKSVKILTDYANILKNRDK